jgi:hypothetical protein
MHEAPKAPKAQAPIFRRVPAPGTKATVVLPAEGHSDQALVTPLGVFVAQRRNFDAIVRDLADPSLALEILFRELPLKARGWDCASAAISRVGTSPDGFPVWHAVCG